MVHGRSQVVYYLPAEQIERRIREREDAKKPEISNRTLSMTSSFHCLPPEAKLSARPSAIQKPKQPKLYCPIVMTMRKRASLRIMRA